MGRLGLFLLLVGGLLGWASAFSQLSAGVLRRGHGGFQSSPRGWKASVRARRRTIPVFCQSQDNEGEAGEKKQENKDERPIMPFDKGASEFVPVDMQPANEWMQLKQEFLFDWPLLSIPEFAARLSGVFAFFAFIISLPIASDTYSQPEEIGFRLLATVIGGMSVTLALVLRFLAGYSFVANRLAAEAVYFETDERRPKSELGLKRLGYQKREYSVRPVEKRLQRSALGLAGGIAACFIAFNILPPPDTGSTAYDPRFMESESRMNELLNPRMEDAANREAERLRARGNKPAYCYSRYYQAIAGGEDVCKN